MTSISMKCLTTKQNFEVENPEVVQLKNGRYAYRAKCPWEGKSGKELYAYKFCNVAAYHQYHGIDPDAAVDATKSEVS